METRERILCEAMIDREWTESNNGCRHTVTRLKVHGSTTKRIKAIPFTRTAALNYMAEHVENTTYNL